MKHLTYKEEKWQLCEILWQSCDRAEDEDPEFIHAFNAYTPPGDVTGDLVFVSLHLIKHGTSLGFDYIWTILSYVNYGRVEDIQKLDELGISLKGRIAISR